MPAGVAGVALEADRPEVLVVRALDLDGGPPVLSTIETWRQPGQQARPWTPAVLDPYRDLAPDCMGRWVVYWRQNMPGLGNTALDDDGRPMKNWWPFLFY